MGARNYAIVALLALALQASAQSFKFRIDPERTFTQGQIQIQFDMSGSFVGDFDSKANPNGSRTKPGLEGAFGVNDNAPVLARGAWFLSENTELHTGGSFDLTVDLNNRTASVSNYVAERLAAGPLGLGAGYRLHTEMFRTAEPDSSWGDDAFPAASSTYQLDAMKLTQRPGAREGTVTPLEDGWYRISINFMADVLLDVLDLRQSAPLTFPVAASLVGNFKITPEGAVFTYPKGKGGDNFTRAVQMPLEDFGIELPGKEKTIRVRYQPTLDRVSLKVNGLRQFLAIGKLATSQN